MRVLYDLTDATMDKRSALSIGVFDGVHLGHRYLIDKMMESAKAGGLLSGVVTFNIHPENVLSPRRGIRYLTTLDEKVALLGRLQLDFAVVLSFTEELAETSARDFVVSLTDQLGMKELWTGPDFALGRGREGDGAFLTDLGRDFGFHVQSPAPLLHEGTLISSSNIRALLSQGQITEASHLLGRYPSLTGVVVRGARRGQELGFPTANLAVDERLLVPPDGIYAVRVRWGDINHEGVVNIGTRPTFEADGERTVEAHVLDFTGDLYGHTLELVFVKRLRPERQFESPASLIAQMKEDIAQTRRLFRELLS